MQEAGEMVEARRGAMVGTYHVRSTVSRASAFVLDHDILLLCSRASPRMPPLALQGVVHKVGVMRKTATVLVTRYVEHPLTHKVGCGLLPSPF